MARKRQVSLLVRVWAALFAIAIGAAVFMWSAGISGVGIVLIGAVVVSFVVMVLAFMARVRREMAKVDRGQR